MSFRIDSVLRTAEAAYKAKPELDKLQKAAGELEASFVKQMLAEMRKAMPKNPLEQSGFGADMYRDMCDDAIAKSVAGRFNLGIANEIMRRSGQDVLRQKLVEVNSDARAASIDANSAPSTVTSEAAR